MMEWLSGGIVVLLALVATTLDLRLRRVPNVVTLPALGMALVLAALQGPGAVGGALAAAGICLLCALPLFLLGGLGGGDVKLMVAFGAFLGPGALLPAFVVMALTGGVLAMVAMVRRRAVGRTFWNLWALARTAGRGSLGAWKGEGPSAWLTIRSPGAITVPYAVAISAGALFGWFV